MARPPRLSKAARREQLLDIALELFARHGYAGATTAELAKAAGVSEPVIYRNFENKRDLFVHLIRRTGDRTIAAWEKRLADAEDPAERLLRLLNENPMVTGEERIAYRVMFKALAETDEPHIRDEIGAHVQKLHLFLVKELSWARQQKKIAGRFSPEIIGWLLIDVGLGYGVLDAVGVTRHGVDTAGNHSRDVIARLLVGTASDIDWPRGSP
jgi:AcrR family transcriptional regulator